MEMNKAMRKGSTSRLTVVEKLTSRLGNRMGNTKMICDAETIWIVSGLPRSGTSLMMQMLQAGGLPILIDKARPPDEHNPRGYFELQKVKHLALDSSWLGESRGKAIKVIVQLIPFLPAGFKYRILFVRRDLREIVRSQERMLQKEQLGTKLPEAKSLIPSFEKAFAQAIAFAGLHPKTQFQVFRYYSDNSRIARSTCWKGYGRSRVDAGFRQPSERVEEDS